MATRGPRPMLPHGYYAPIREELRKRVLAMIKISMPDLLTAQDIFELFVPVEYQDLSRQWGELTSDQDDKRFWTKFKLGDQPMRLFIHAEGGAFVYAEPPKMGSWVNDTHPAYKRLMEMVAAWAALHQKYGAIVSLLDTFQETLKINHAFVYLPSIKHVFGWAGMPVSDAYMKRPDKLDDIGRELTLACYEVDEALTSLSLLKNLEPPKRAVRIEAQPISAWVTRWGKTIDNF